MPKSYTIIFDVENVDNGCLVSIILKFKGLNSETSMPLCTKRYFKDVQEMNIVELLKGVDALKR